MTLVTRLVCDGFSRGSTAIAALSFLWLATPSVAAAASSAYDVDVLVSDGSVPADFIDPHCSAVYLAGLEKNPLPTARFWFLTRGWSLAGPIDVGRIRSR